MVNGIAQSMPTLSNKPASNGLVQVYVRTHYGTKHYYPANRPAELFLKVQGGKVLTQQTLRTLKAAGYEIEFRYDEERI
jgi:hypothetical protein